MSVRSNGSHPNDADDTEELLREAYSERERADAEVRRAIRTLLEYPDSPEELRDNTAVALVRARVSRVRYAAVLSAAGRFVPVHLVNDVSER